MAKSIALVVLVVTVLVFSEIVILSRGSSTEEKLEDSRKCQTNQDQAGFVDLEPNEDILAASSEADCDVDDSVTGAEEGDMVMEEDAVTQEGENKGDDSGAEEELKLSERKVISSTRRLWPGAIVPYAFNTGRRRFVKNESRQVIVDAMAQWEKNTCLQFVERGSAGASQAGHGAYLDIGSGPGCAATVGFRGDGPHPVYLNEDRCMQLGTVIHELGHAIGFFHEQARADRNDYVVVHDENVRNRFEANFRTSPLASDMEKYDLSSVMHYGPKSFSKNGEDTLTARDKYLQFLLGRRNHLSFYDIKLANEAYGCAEGCRKGKQCAHDGILLQNCSCLCPSGLGGDTCDEIDNRVAPGCGSVIRVTTGESVTLDTVQLDTYKRRCIWLIESPPGTLLAASLRLRLDLDQVTRRCASWLEMRYSYVGQDGPKFCGHVPTARSFPASTNLLLLDYHRAKTGPASRDWFQVQISVDVGSDKGFQCDFAEGLDSCAELKQSDQTVTWTKKQAPYHKGDFYIEAKNDSPKDVSTGFHTGSLSAGAWCLSLRYQDPTQPSLLVLAILADGTRAARAITSQQESRSQVTGSEAEATWTRSAVSIVSDKEFRISLHLDISTGSYLALDDFSVVRGQCRDTKDIVYLDTSHGQRVLTCTFDSDTCGWHVLESGSATLNWVATSQAPFFGPLFDHTQQKFNTGKFILRNSWKKPPGSKASIQSPLASVRVVPGCLHFWLYAKGRSPGDVTVILAPEGGAARPIWNAALTGLLGVSWSEVRVPLETLLPFKVVFESTVDYWFNAVAIDDVYVEDVPCQTVN